MADKIRVLLVERGVDKRISEATAKTSEEYAGKEIHLICTLKGRIFSTCELAKRLTIPISPDFVSVSSCGAGTESSSVVRIPKDLDKSLAGEDMLIMEDITGSERTLTHLTEALKQRGPKSIRLYTLFDKSERRAKKQVKANYACFTISDKFVVGYGLDCDQEYRNLPYIGVVELDQGV